MYDYVVVGGGPAGLLCASKCKLNGLVLEEHEEIGSPVSCSGLLSRSGLEKLGVSGDFVLNRVRGAIFHAGKDSATIDGGEGVAYVVDRAAFDRGIARGCKADVLLGERCRRVLRKAGHFVFETDESKFEAKKAVLASGTNSALHNGVGLEGPNEFIRTVQYAVSGSFEKNFVHLYLDEAPGFFAWLIPVNKGEARVGLGTVGAEGSPGHYQKKFLSRLEGDGVLEKGFEIKGKAGGLIPLYDAGMAWEKDDAYLVGDAAGQVKATTGGGVIIGGLCAIELAKCLSRGGGYDDATRKLRSELRLHLMLRGFIGKSNPATLVRFLKSESVRRIIEGKGDMDMVSGLMKGFLKSPPAIANALPLLRDFIF